MPNYSAIATSVANGLSRGGAACTLRTVTRTFNSSTGAVTSSTADTAGLSCLLLSKSDAGKTFGGNNFDTLFAEATKADQRVMLLSASGVVTDPKGKDLVIVGSDTWEVLGVDILEPNGTTPVLYTMGVQK